MGEGLLWEDHAEDSRVGATFMKTDCVQFCQSVRLNRTVACLGTNIKKYATCKN